MFFLFKRKKKRKIYAGLSSINFCGKIDNRNDVVVKFPNDPTLFSFSLPAARRIEEYFHGTKYGIFTEDSYPFVSRFLRYTKLFPKERDKIRKIDFNKTVLLDFELSDENAGTKYPFKIRIGFKKELYPALNVIYTLKEPSFPSYYDEIVKNITGMGENIWKVEQKVKKGWAWEFVKYLGMTYKKKIISVDFYKENTKIRKVIKEKHSDRWFIVFFDELHDISIDQKIAILLISDVFLFDTSYYAYFAVKEGINSYKIGELPFKVSDESSLNIIKEKDVLQIIK